MDYILLFGKNYLGIYFIPLIMVIFLDIFFTFIKNKKKRSFYKTRLLFSMIFIISVSVTGILGFLYYNKNLLEINIINLCLVKFNLGFLMTYFITYIFSTFKLNYIFIATSILIFISLFFLIGKEIIGTIKYFINCKRRREALKLQKALLKQMQTKIAIKEKIEEKKAEEYEKQNIILDTVIKEKIEKAIEEKTLPLDGMEEEKVEFSNEKNLENENQDENIDNENNLENNNILENETIIENTEKNNIEISENDFQEENIKENDSLKINL